MVRMFVAPMATPFSIPVTAAQVGTYFVGQYHQVLQRSPDCIYQFYSDASTMLRIDGNIRDTATGMPQIHALVSALNYSAIEIKTAHSLESWNQHSLRLSKGQPVSSVTSQPPLIWNMPLSSEWNHIPESTVNKVTVNRKVWDRHGTG